MAERVKPIRILSLDISASPGYASIEIRNGKPKLLAADSVKTTNDMTDSERYSYVEASVTKFVYEQGPFDYVTRENFIKGGSKRATQLVFGSWSVIDMALGKFGYYVSEKAEITNSRVKAVVGGHGGDGKDVVAEGARKLFNLPEDYVWKSNDASDAAAIGYTYAHDKGLLQTGVKENDKSKGKTK
jgi:crossover junction endodeoxyribonuclease RuvC